MPDAPRRPPTSRLLPAGKPTPAAIAGAADIIDHIEIELDQIAELVRGLAVQVELLGERVGRLERALSGRWG